VNIDKGFPHDCIILDACCVINLYASGKMRTILQVIPRNLSIAAYVKDHEALNIYSGPIDNVQAISESIDLQPFVDDNLLFLAYIDGEVEESAYVNLAQSLDDGEAVTGAIALNRNWAIATDDSASMKLFQRTAPHIALVSTLDLIKHWVDTNKPSDDIVHDALLNIRVRGRYEPHRNHPLGNWWRKFL